MSTQLHAKVTIPAGHPDLKGSFTCLGNWYNLHDDQSMIKLNQILAKITSKKDKGTAIHEIEEARQLSLLWSRDPTLSFLYESANTQGNWNIKF